MEEPPCLRTHLLLFFKYQLSAMDGVAIPRPAPPVFAGGAGHDPGGGD